MVSYLAAVTDPEYVMAVLGGGDKLRISPAMFKHVRIAPERFQTALIQMSMDVHCELVSRP